MQNTELYNAMFYRQSVRSFAPAPLSPEIMTDIKSFLDELPPLCGGVQSYIQLLGPMQISRCISAPHYATAYADDSTFSRLTAGYYLEHLGLYLASRDLGCCFNGTSRTHESCASFRGVPAVITMAFGTPKKPERRTGPGAYKRKPLSEIASSDLPLGLSEAVRVAPSAMNAQPWSLVGNRDKIGLRYTPSGLRWRVVRDLAAIDMGIALAHLCIAARQQDRKYTIDFDPVPDTTLPRNHRLVCEISFL